MDRSGVRGPSSCRRWKDIMIQQAASLCASLAGRLRALENAAPTHKPTEKGISSRLAASSCIRYPAAFKVPVSLSPQILAPPPPSHCLSQSRYIHHPTQYAGYSSAFSTQTNLRNRPLGTEASSLIMQTPPTTILADEVCASAIVANHAYIFLLPHILSEVPAAGAKTKRCEEGCSVWVGGFGRHG